MRLVGADEYPALRGKQIETAIWRYSTWIDESTDGCRAFCVPKGEHTSLEMTALNESSGVNVLKEFHSDIIRNINKTIFISIDINRR